MIKPAPKRPRGKPGVFDKSLGPVVPEKQSFPAPIWELLKDPRVKLVLNQMALNPKFKDKIFKLVPTKIAKKTVGTEPEIKPEIQAKEAP